VDDPKGVIKVRQVALHPRKAETRFHVVLWGGSVHDIGGERDVAASACYRVVRSSGMECSGMLACTGTMALIRENNPVLLVATKERCA